MIDNEVKNPIGPITLANIKVIGQKLYDSDSCTRKELQDFYLTTPTKSQQKSPRPH